MKKGKNHEERRSARRKSIPENSSLQASLLAGPAVRLVNMSSCGALFGSKKRLSPGVTISLRFVVGEEELVVKSRVLRSSVKAIMKGFPIYECAVQFLGDVTGSAVGTTDSVERLMNRLPELMEGVEAEVAPANGGGAPGDLVMTFVAPEPESTGHRIV